VEAVEAYREFQAEFSEERLSALNGIDILKTIFYTKPTTQKNLTYWLEHKKPISWMFGGISVGSVGKFGITQKDDGSWIDSSDNTVTETKAIEIGKGFRDALLKALRIVQSHASFKTVADYELLFDKLNAEIGGYIHRIWIHKYLHMMFPEVFGCWHTLPWQRHVLLGCAIRPTEYKSDKDLYVQSGMLSIIAQELGMSNAATHQFMHDVFGGVKHFYRNGVGDRTDNFYSIWRDGGYTAIGWNDLGDLSKLAAEGKLEKAHIQKTMFDTWYSAQPENIASKKAGEVVSFYNCYDWYESNAIIVAMKGAFLLGLGVCGKGYTFDNSTNYAHRRPVEWLNRAVPERLPEGLEVQASFTEIKGYENLLKLYDILYRGEEAEIEQREEPFMIVERKPRTAADKVNPLNLIVYGAPGTGKTYSVPEYALAALERRAVDPTNLGATKRAATMKKFNDSMKDGRIVFTTFHQSYGYEDFIQGLRPVPVSGGISFVPKPGTFMAIAQKAMKDLENNYVIIIDEINRGNISKIFGELITLIEDDKRWGEANALSVVLPSGEAFAVPNNLYIVGTMNTADKSISLIDSALRRRFRFEEQKPDASLVADAKLKAVLTNINKFLEKELDSTDLLIGHAYFIGKTDAQLVDIMNNNIIPLLYEYFYDSTRKIKACLEKAIEGTGCTVEEASMGRLRLKKG